MTGYEKNPNVSFGNNRLLQLHSQYPIQPTHFTLELFAFNYPGGAYHLQIKIPTTTINLFRLYFGSLIGNGSIMKNYMLLAVCLTIFCLVFLCNCLRVECLVIFENLSGVHLNRWCAAMSQRFSFSLRSVADTRRTIEPGIININKLFHFKMWKIVLKNYTDSGRMAWFDFF